MLAAGLIALAGCDERATGVDGILALSDEPLIRTSADSYLLEATSIGWETEIPFSYTNPGPGPYFLVNCNGAYGFVLERWTGQRWVAGYVPVLPACLSPVIRIDPGETFSHRIPVFGGFPGSNWEPKFEFAEPAGRYRIVLETLESFDADTYPFGDPLPLELRVSNTFELVTD